MPLRTDKRNGGGHKAKERGEKKSGRRRPRPSKDRFDKIVKAGGGPEE